MPSGVANRRWEFKIKPGENAAEFSKPDKAWELLSPWVKPSDGELERHAVYRFRSSLARGWRNGRLLIAGDAAHLMPPFMGQGMCSGMRDSWKLAWKLDRVLKGSSPEALLDTYEVERAPHVDACIRISMEMGKVICVPDVEAAKARDEAFFSGAPPPPPIFPAISGGMIADEPGAGLLTPHDDMETPQGVRRLDDIVGRNFALVGDATNIAKLGNAARAAAASVGVALAPIGAGAYRDQTGRISAWLARYEACAVLTRPDFYAFGLARNPAQVERLLATLVAKLAN